MVRLELLYPIGGQETLKKLSYKKLFLRTLVKGAGPPYRETFYVKFGIFTWPFEATQGPSKDIYEAM